MNAAQKKSLKIQSKDLQPMIRINDYVPLTPDYSTLSDADKALLEKSLETDDWSIVSNYEKQAESEEAREVLHNRKMTLYHREELFAGIL
jgi:hypothetical protein